MARLLPYGVPVRYCIWDLVAREDAGRRVLGGLTSTN